MSITGSEAEKAQKNRRVLGCFFVFFTLMGLAFSAVFLFPVVQIVRAMAWRQVPCTILSSEVESHRGSKGGSTYSVAVKYEYVVDDQRYTGDRYKFFGGSSSGYDGKKAIVDRLAPGTQAVCYVNRRDPSDSVIERGFTADLLFVGIPLIFVAIGVGGIYGVFIRKPAPRPVTAGAGLIARPPPTPAKGGGTLKAKQSPAARLGCMACIALFWNGITSIFVVEIVSGWAKGDGDGCGTVFMIPFVLAGLALIASVVYYFLALFNPRPSLRIAGGTAALGDTIDVEWETEGNVDRVKVFTLTFEGREEATYRRGTSTATDKSTFLTMTLVSLHHGKEMRRGKVSVAIPEDTMHTFKSRNNKIYWCLKVSGDIPNWPDINEEFEIEVLPQRTPGGAR